MDRWLEAAEEEQIGEFQVAEYIVFLLALDTYMRYSAGRRGSWWQRSKC